MTLANKIIPAFYVVDLQGDAASLMSIIGSNHRIKNVTISSADFKNDLDAYSGMDKTISFFKGELSLRDEITVNPEFFPSAPPIEVTPEMEAFEEIAHKAEEQLEGEGEGEGVTAVAITRRFDDWGDFVSVKREVCGDGFIIKAKVAVNPRRYVLEKNIEKQEHQERLYGPSGFTGTIALH